MSSQHEDVFERGGCCAGYGVFDMCWMGGRKILGMEQHAMERMGEKRQGEI